MTASDCRTPVGYRAENALIPDLYPGALTRQASGCQLCPRLVEFRETLDPDDTLFPQRARGSLDADLLIVGMAPEAFVSARSLSGQTLLLRTLARNGFSEGRALDDTLCYRVTSAVRCPSPTNLPQPAEVTQCNPFLRGELQAMPRLKIVLTLGVLAHTATLAACGIPAARVHHKAGQIVTLPDGLLLANASLIGSQGHSDHTMTENDLSALIAEIAARL